MQPRAVRIPYKQFILLPAGCLHFPIGEIDLLKAWVEELRTTPQAYGILMGDSMDAARTHYRNHVRSYRDDENSQEALDAYTLSELGKLADILRPVAKRILGVVRGNHYWEFLDGTNSEQRLCQMLEIPYLGSMGLIRLDCFVRGNHTQSLVVYAHHTGGSAGGRTTGGDVNALTRSENVWDADIYLLGHTHRRIAFKEPVMTITRKTTPPRVQERSRVFVRTGAFLKGFKEEQIPVNARYAPSYAEEKALRPTDLGWVKIEVTWRQRGSGARAKGEPSSGRTDYPEYRLTY